MEHMHSGVLHAVIWLSYAILLLGAWRLASIALVRSSSPTTSALGSAMGAIV